MNRTLLLLLVLALSCGCKKERAKTLGCMDCEALNFDPFAEVEDNSCMYQETNRLGTYSMTDSLSDHQAEALQSEQTYTIHIQRAECSADSFVITGLTNYRPSTPFPVMAGIKGDSLIIAPQAIEGPNYDYDEDWGNKLYIRNISAWFKGDSIFIDGFFGHHNDHYYHRGWGVKQL